ncbi:MAG: hypothetical protein ABIU06_18170 [Anaerolineales bacterium]
MTKPDFYMTSSEGYMPAVYKCFSIKRLRLMDRNDLLLIRIEPSLSGTRYKLPNTEIDKIFIASRHRGESLFQIKKWPVSVYVLAPLTEQSEEMEELKENECKLIAWAEIYQTESSAISNS